jgi:hypothetical protein
LEQKLPLNPLNNPDRRPSTKDLIFTGPSFEFTGCQNGSQPLENILVNPVSPQKEKDDFILHLAEEIIKMNRGVMEINADDEKLITIISLILPMQERRPVQYQSTTA